MSTSLYWKPPVKEHSFVGTQIKYHLAPKLWGHDGTLSSEWTIIDKSLIPFLEKLKGKEVRAEAQKLIKLIRKHGQIEISLIT